MAKKKLSDYQKARRQFVQQRTAAKGGDVTKEQKQQFRQRFDVLASTKQGRTQLAQRALPNAPQEDRAAYKRVLATELPARKPTTTTTTTTTTSTPPVTSYTADQIARMRAGAATMGPQLSQINKPPAGSFGATQKLQSYTGPSTKKSSNTWKDNSVVQTVRKGLIATVPGLGDVSQSRTEFGKGNVVGGVGRLAMGTVQTAAFVGTLFGLGGGKAPGGKVVSQGPSVRPTPPKVGKGAPTRPQAPGATTPKPSGTKTPGRKVSGTKTPGTKTSSTKTSSTKTSSTKASTSKAPTSKAPTVKINKQGGIGSKKYGPAAPPKPTTTKPAATKGPKVSKEATEDLAYQLTQVKNRFPGATEKDLGFVQQLNRAQTAIEKNAPGSQAYAKWLQNKSTQATLRRLRGK